MRLDLNYCFDTVNRFFKCFLKIHTLALVPISSLIALNFIPIDIGYFIVVPKMENKEIVGKGIKFSFKCFGTSLIPTLWHMVYSSKFVNENCFHNHFIDFDVGF